MAVKITKRATNDGARYSISGLTFAQLFRIKQAMFAEADKMKAISEEHSDEIFQRKFEKFRQDANAVYEAISYLI